jgi:hypothetical protein
MAITRSNELRNAPAACDTKSSSRIIAIIIRSLNNTGTITIIITVALQFFLTSFH